MTDTSMNRVVHFPFRTLTAALALTGVLLAGLVWSTYGIHQEIELTHTRNLHIEELRGIIIHLDEVLTMSARMAAATGDSNWEKRYRRYEPQLGSAVKEAIKLTSQSGIAEAAAQTDAANIKLVEMENKAFECVRDNRPVEARTVLFSPAYEDQKKVYADGMTNFMAQLRGQVALSQQRATRVATASITAVMASILLLLTIWLTVVRRLSQWRIFQAATIAKLTKTDAELRTIHNELEKRVEERTAELSSANAGLSTQVAARKKAQHELEITHEKLIKASRMAGMAEVATSVLHNVGNVLNSLNVSAGVIKNRLAQSKSGNLGRAAGLLNEHRDDLGAFLTADERGKQLPHYLGMLAEALAEEQKVMLDEFTSMTRNIDHIKEIVGAQQSYARVPMVAEAFELSEVIEDAVRINLAGLERHRVRIEQDLQFNPRLCLDKHQLLQILVNLVSNAKRAVCTRGQVERKITFRIEQRREGDREYVRIAVIDNGEGIPSENLTKIFNHGFTTRSEGHGFGLHSAALAAKALGGSLDVRSDGPGTGATFTLELPLTRVKVAA